MQRLKGILRKAIYGLIHICSYRKTILFESMPDCSDNTKAVFDEMVRRGINRKYDLVWILHSDNTPQETIPHVRYVAPSEKGRKYRLRNMCLFARAKCMLCCNGFLYPVLKRQKAYFLSHGTPIKSVRKYYNIPTMINHCLAASEDSARILAYESKYPLEQMFVLGYPRNDVFSQVPRQIKTMLNTECSHIVVWYPTYRQHKNGKTTGSKNTLPIIHDSALAKRLNAYACEKNILVVLKPHFAQDLSYVKELGLSNIRLIDDSFFANNHISSYEFVAACDGLITDYSSIYYDYTLADKPVAVVWEDIEEYRNDPGFAVDVDNYLKGAQKIYTIDQFEAFLNDVVSGVDVLQEDRREIRDLLNYATDGQNSKRVVDYIVATSKL